MNLEQQKRLLRHFARAFPGTPPEGMRRVPGRVNLIGEHTDYNGYPVLPMAIDRDILVAFRRRSDGYIRIANTDPVYGERAFSTDALDRSFPQGDWGNYVLAAARGLAEEDLIDASTGLDACFDGRIPPAAGLSSSSALLVSGALALLAVNDTATNPLHLAELLARAERYAGIEGGGMDQAIVLLAEEGSALHMDFFPLRVHAVPVPAGVSIVVCDSLVRAPKTAAMRYAYNLRAVECRLALALALKALNDASVHPPHAERLADIEQAIADSGIGRQVEALMEGEALSIADIAARTGRTDADLVGACCTTRDGGIVEAEGYRVASRYRHVIRESMRVRSAAEALQSGDVGSFGALMNASHESCRNDFHISTPELDTLVELARSNGALGARLTGAGFGGCTVNLVPSTLVPEFLQAMHTHYYEERQQELVRERVTAGDAVFECRPSGAGGPVPLP